MLYQDKLRFLISNNISVSSSHRAIVWLQKSWHSHMDHFYDGFVVLLVHLGDWQPWSSSTFKVKKQAAQGFEQHEGVQIDVMNYGLKLHAKLIWLNVIIMLLLFWLSFWQLLLFYPLYNTYTI